MSAETPQEDLFFDISKYLEQSSYGEETVTSIKALSASTNHELSKLSTYVSQVRSENVLVQIEGAIKIRKLLSTSGESQVSALKDVFERDLHSDLISIMKHEDNKYLKMEVAWCLTNLASGNTEQVVKLIERGLIEVFVNVLDDPCIPIAEQALWGLGNISGDCVKFRDKVLEEGGLIKFVELYEKVKNKAPPVFLRNLVWAASNQCRLRPAPKKEFTRPAIPMFCDMFKKEAEKSKNNENYEKSCLTDCLWALSGIMGKTGVAPFLEENILEAVINVINLPIYSMVVVHPALRIIGCFSNEEADICQLVINFGAIKKLHGLLNSTTVSIKKEACWIFSNITAGTQSQSLAVLSNEPLVDKIISLIKVKSTQVKTEAIWVLCNATLRLTKKWLKFLLSKDILNVFIDQLKLEAQTSKIICVILNGLTELIKRDKSFDTEEGDIPIVEQMSEKGIIEALGNLQSREEEKVIRISSKLLIFIQGELEQD